MFSEEKERQVNSIPRLEKIEVLYQVILLYCLYST